jgi:hypothetical protein
LLAAALLLAAREAKTDTHTWRKTRLTRPGATSARWSSGGYEPSAVEQLILTLPDDDTD